MVLTKEYLSWNCRARCNVFWPGMTNDIYAVCDSYVIVIVMLHTKQLFLRYCQTHRPHVLRAHLPTVLIMRWVTFRALEIDSPVGQMCWHAIWYECRWGSCVSWPSTGLGYLKKFRLIADPNSQPSLPRVFFRPGRLLTACLPRIFPSRMAALRLPSKPPRGCLWQAWAQMKIWTMIHVCVLFCDT